MYTAILFGIIDIRKSSSFPEKMKHLSSKNKYYKEIKLLFSGREMGNVAVII